jgi:hypothetical protein
MMTTAAGANMAAPMTDCSCAAREPEWDGAGKGSQVRQRGLLEAS